LFVAQSGCIDTHIADLGIRRRIPIGAEISGGAFKTNPQVRSQQGLPWSDRRLVLAIQIAPQNGTIIGIENMVPRSIGETDTRGILTIGAILQVGSATVNKIPKL